MRRIAFSLLAFGFACAGAEAAILYKLVDPAGNVTFADAVPSGFRGEVTRMEIDTTSMPPVRPAKTVIQQAAQLDAELAKRRLAQEQRESEIEAARARVDAARVALEDAQNNSLPTDWIYVSQNNPLGMRRFPSPEFQAKLAQLEASLAQAQSALDALERAERLR
jgi:hypothetical protein